MDRIKRALRIEGYGFWLERCRDVALLIAQAGAALPVMPSVAFNQIVRAAVDLLSHDDLEELSLWQIKTKKPSMTEVRFGGSFLF